MKKQTTFIRLVGIPVFTAILLLNIWTLKSGAQPNDLPEPQAQARYVEPRGAKTTDSEFHKFVKEMRFKQAEMQVKQRLFEIYENLGDAEDLDEDG